MKVTRAQQVRMRKRWAVGMIAAIVALLSAGVATARFRQANEEYAARRSKLVAQVDGPVVVFGVHRPRRPLRIRAFFSGEKFLLPYWR